MSTKSWTVVKFEDENTVEAVPTTWILGSSCYWPPYSRDKLVAAIKNFEAPNTHWPLHKMEVFRNATFDSYLEARKESNVAEYASDLNIDEEASTRKNRHKRAKTLSSSSYRKELKKIKDSQRSGASADDIYQPTLWYFELLQFTIDQKTATDSISNMESSTSGVGDSCEEWQDQQSNNAAQIEVENSSLEEEGESSQNEVDVTEWPNPLRSNLTSLPAYFPVTPIPRETVLVYGHLMRRTLDSHVLRASAARVEIHGHNVLRPVLHACPLRVDVFKKMERDKFDTELLMDEVEKRVPIWDMESSDYSNKGIKRRKLKEFVEMFCEAGDSEEKKKALGKTLDSHVLRASAARVEIHGHNVLRPVLHACPLRVDVFKKMERDKFDTELLIDEVEKRVPIWDMESSDYSNKGIKRRKLKEFVEMFCEAGDSEEKKKALGILLQKKWKELSDGFVREIKRKKTTPSGSGASGKTKYIYFERLKFLERSIHKKTTDSNINTTSATAEEQDFSGDGEDIGTKSTDVSNSFNILTSDQDRLIIPFDSVQDSIETNPFCGVAVVHCEEIQEYIFELPEIQQTSILDAVTSDIQVIENTEYSVINESRLLQNVLEKENIEVLATDERADTNSLTSDKYQVQDEDLSLPDQSIVPIDDRNTRTYSTATASSECSDTSDVVSKAYQLSDVTISENFSMKNIQQPTLQSFTVTKRRCKKIDYALTYFIAVDMQPFSVVEDIGFRNLIEVLQPSYSMPSIKTISEVEIPKLYHTTKDSIMRLLDTTDFKAFTTDAWTSAASKPYVSLTAHFILGWEMKSVTLNCREMTEDHTAENMASVLLDLLREWEIPREKIISFITDSGANVKNAVKLMNFQHVSCLGHNMNLAISKVFRWWSMLNLIKAIIDNKVPLRQLLEDYQNGKHRNLTLTISDIDKMKFLVDILYPIMEITDVMTGEKYITGSAILPLCMQIKNMTYSIDTDKTNVVEEMNVIKVHVVENILNYFEDRYIRNENVRDFLTKCSLLDPRFKHFEIDGKNSSEIQNNILDEANTVPYMNNDESKPDNFKKRKFGSIFTLFKQNEVSEGHNGREIEVQKYFHYDSLEIDEDPLK
ncbi:unnamed protein product [Phaedon cochleariae]|uniref:MADF domain-containing protein n=1 Tax=Phaedon cochleariae TaxID=80249 RepID=A0A9N9SG97_PHACE|nr:unnamed protein product [Phaedon cochleariae]